jgi:hypothetical protein
MPSLAVVSLSGVPLMMPCIFPLVGHILVYAALFSKALDLDIQDAIIFAVVTGLMRFAALIMFIHMMTESGYM